MSDKPKTAPLHDEVARLARLDKAIAEALDGFDGPEDLLECEPKHWWRALSTILAAIKLPEDPA